MKIVGLLLCAQIYAQGSIYNVRDFSAVADGRTVNTRAIQSAIDVCAEKGGGTVYVPAGEFVTGTLQLRSKITLYLENGAVLKGSADLKDYELNGRRVGLLYTDQAEQVAIVGQGVIDGNDDVFFIWDKAKRIENAGLGYVRQKERFRQVTAGIGDGPVVPKERPYQMIIFSRCKNVLLRDVTILDSPFWTLHFADCDGVVVSGIKLWADMLAPNADGIDVTSCSNVLISDCDIRSGDDCIAITGYDHHFDLPGYHNIRHASENVNVSNCNLESRSAGIRIGGMDQNTMRNYQFSNINITGSNRGIGIFLRDEGSIENMTFSNFYIETRLHTGDWWGHGEPIHISAMRAKKEVPLGHLKNLRFSNIICRGESGIVLYGTEEGVLQNISFTGLTLQLTDSPLNDVAGGNMDLRPVAFAPYQLFSHDIPAFFAQHVSHLSIEDFILEWDPVRQPFFTHGIEVDHFDNLRIRDFSGTGAPGHSGAYPVMLKNGCGAEVNVPVRQVRKENVK